DLHLGLALRRGRDTGSIVRTNPYECGSEHTVSARAGVPAHLNWHFTDRYYDTCVDTADKPSDEPVGRARLVVATAAMFLATADATDAGALDRLVEEAEQAPMATERRNDASDDILSAWRRWYAEARASVAAVAR